MIEVLQLFPKLNASLIDLLEGLTSAQWYNSTICKKWSVKDIAAHLLDTALRRVSHGRDNHFAKTPEMHSHSNLLEFLNGLNAEWVSSYRRVSPEVLTRQILAAQEELYEYLLTVDLLAPAIYPVAWAGEKQSQQWFDIAREYTERWHHQQQIRLAVGADSILERELYFPFLDISMLALPFHFSSKQHIEGTAVEINIIGDAGGKWTIIKRTERWEFTREGTETNNQVYIDQNIAWMLLSKGIDIQEAQQYWQITGDYDLGYHALKMTTFMV